MGSNLFGALRLGGVGHPVPHDRVDDLQPLSCQRLERLAVRHAPLSAPSVVIAPSSLCPGKAVAREYEQVLQPLVALARCRHRGDRGSRLAVARRQAAVRREPVVTGEVFDVDGDRELGSGFGPDARHRQEASVGIVALEQGGDLRRDRLDLRRVLGYPAREQFHRPVLGGDDRRIRPCRGGCRADEGLDLAARRPARERRRPAGPGVGYRPGPAEGCHEPQLGPVGQVDQRLEGGARFQQDAAQPVLVPSVLAGQEVPLGGQRPRRRNRRTWVSDRQERVGDAKRRLRDDHRVSLVGLGVAGEEPGGPVRRESRQVRRRHPGRPGAGEREGAYVARLVDDHERIGEAAEQRVQVVLPVRDGGAQQYLAVPGRDACPMGQFPDIEPDDGFRHSRWCHGVILQSVGRSEPLPATPTLPGRGACARQFPISRPERRAPPVATPPGPSTGQGQTAIRRRPIGGPSGLARIVGNAPNARHRNLSMAYFRL